MGFILNLLYCLNGLVLSFGSPREPHDAVLSDDDLASGGILEHHHHASLLADYPRHLAWHYMEYAPLRELSQTRTEHAQVYEVLGCDIDYLCHDVVSEVEVSRQVRSPSYE